MNKPGVYIIGLSDTDEKVCAAAGRISTQSGTALEIMEKSQDKEKNAKLISKVTASGHTSTVEHTFFNLAFENVSVVVEQFMIEFRLASFTVKSRRYVDFSSSGYYVPDFENEDCKKKYIKHMDSLFALYGELTKGGVAKEDARFVLPYCFYSNFFCSLGGRELINVLRAMLFGRGSKIHEVHKLGTELLAQCKEKAPGIFGNFEKQYSAYNDETNLDFIDDKKEENMQSVEILSYTPDAADVVAKCALINEKGLSIKEAEEIISDSKTKEKIIDAVLASSRPRPLESINYTVRFNDVSLSTLTHFSRHRMQSLLVPSLNSCDRTKYIIPKSIYDNKDLLEKYCSAFSRTQELLTYLQNSGCSESETVYCLLSGNTLDIVSTMNGRELELFMKLRTCTRAQWEIRELSVELLKQLRVLCPEIFKKFGPSCFRNGFCPEGKLTCGKMNEIKKLFLNL
ncbi:MAG: FAD-dependent thymidylate synthase [Acutalibacteraceae bacterium]